MPCDLTALPHNSCQREQIDVSSTSRKTSPFDSHAGSLEFAAAAAGAPYAASAQASLTPFAEEPLAGNPLPTQVRLDARTASSNIVQRGQPHFFRAGSRGCTLSARLDPPCPTCSSPSP